MRILYLVILFSVVLCKVESQQFDCACPVDDDYSAKLQATLMGFEYTNPIEGYKGKHYFNSWTLGEVELNNGDVIKEIYLQYDQYKDELMWLRKTDRRTGIIPKDYIHGFRLFNPMNELMATFVKRKVAIPYMGLRDAYLQLLVPGEPALLAFRYSTVMASANQLIEKSLYFISASGIDYLIKPSRKDLMANPAINHDSMKETLHVNRIGIKNNEEGLIRAMQLYNQLHK